MNESNTHSFEMPRNFQKPRTCNEAAAQLFPGPAKVTTAFIELEEASVTHIPRLLLQDLQDDFWALTLEHTVYVPSENQFRQYQANSGVYEPVTEATLIGQIITNLNRCADLFPSRLKYDTFLVIKNRQRIKGVVERAKDLLQSNEFFVQHTSPYHINCANGILNIVTRKFTAFSPDQPIKEKLPVKYDSEAKCDTFLQAFLQNILDLDDIDLLQRFCSQFLIGQNHAQKILVLTGDAGWGKSTLMKILGTLVGWNRVGIIRDQIYRNEFELGHYANKHFLYHPDMPTQFLNLGESSIFKQLVGGDPIWAETKANDERRVIEGIFPVVLACNGKPQIKLDQDTDAWTRRLIVLSFKKPDHEQHLGKMAEILLRTEMSGVLNWLVDGYAKLHKAGQTLTQTPEQQTRTTTLLISSESPQAFVRTALVKKVGAVMGAADLYEHYQSWCRSHQMQPFSSKQFMKTVRLELEIGFGLKYRHDLKDEGGGWMRGWKGLAVVETDTVVVTGNASEVSG